MKPSLPKGTRDFLPHQMILRKKVIAIIEEVFQSYGYEPLETPAIEKIELLQGKAGEEADHLFFKILKRGEGEKRGEFDLGLRFELTLSLARVVAMYGDLPMPFKRYQTQPVWRAERPQKGRYREFWQCDADCVGTPSMMADAEIIAMVNAILTKLGFKKFNIGINNRKILHGLLNYAGIEDKQTTDALICADKLDKIEMDGVLSEMAERGISNDAAKKFINGLAFAGSTDEVLRHLETTLTSGTGREGWDEMQQLFDYLSAMGVPPDNYRFNLSIVRGLGYYTGPVFETFVEEPKIGSITGGGRYDKLVGVLSGRDIPCTGTSIGLERIIDVMTELGIMGATKTATQVLVTVFDEDTAPASLTLANELRVAGINCEVYLTPKTTLGKQFGYAEKKGIPLAIVLGPDEIASGKAGLKIIETREQKEIGRAELIGEIESVLQ
ncbi:MAG: histidine--tRNA ligase [bacterium]|nr:histidine--tRNA ligase [bacterium]